MEKYDPNGLDGSIFVAQAIYLLSSAPCPGSRLKVVLDLGLFGHQLRALVSDGRPPRPGICLP